MNVSSSSDVPDRGQVLRLAEGSSIQQVILADGSGVGSATAVRRQDAQEQVPIVPGRPGDRRLRARRGLRHAERRARGCREEAVEHLDRAAGRARQEGPRCCMPTHLRLTIHEIDRRIRPSSTARWATRRTTPAPAFIAPPSKLGKLRSASEHLHVRRRPHRARRAGAPCGYDDDGVKAHAWHARRQRHLRRLPDDARAGAPRSARRNRTAAPRRQLGHASRSSACPTCG